MEYYLWWKTAFDGRQPSMGDNLLWTTTLDGRWPWMEDDFGWKTTFDRRQPKKRTKFWNLQQPEGRWKGQAPDTFCLYQVRYYQALAFLSNIETLQEEQCWMPTTVAVALSYTQQSNRFWWYGNQLYYHPSKWSNFDSIELNQILALLFLCILFF